MKTKSNHSNVVILGRPLMKKSWKAKLQEDMDRIGDFYNLPSCDDKEEILECSREPFCD